MDLHNNILLSKQFLKNVTHLKVRFAYNTILLYSPTMTR